MTGQSSAALASAYTAQTKRQWTQPIGFAHALFELTADIVKRSKDPSDRAAVLDALKKTKLDTVVGPIAWTDGPFKNVAKTPLVGGQWRATPKGPFQYDLVITENATAPAIAIQDRMQLIT